MKIGMCGVCGLGVEIAEIFGLHPDVEDVVVADLNSKVCAKASQLQGVSRGVESLDQLLDLDLDCIGVFTPPWSHAELSIQALKAGKHVICACPAGLTLDECHSLVDTVRDTGKIYMTAETSYYYPAAIFARMAWAEGRFGDFVHAEGEYYYRPHNYDFWMREYYGNMPSILYPTHSTSIAISTTGKHFEQVTCVGTPGLHPDVVALPRRPQWQHNETSNMTLLGRMSGGGTCRINEMRNVGCKGEVTSIFGTLGSLRQQLDNIEWTNGFEDEKAEDIDLTRLWQDPKLHPQAELAGRLPPELEGHGMGHFGSHRFLVDEFVRAVTTNSRPHNHVWAAVKYCAPGIVGWESIQKDSAWCPVPNFGPPTDARNPLE